MRMNKLAVCLAALVSIPMLAMSAVEDELPVYTPTSGVS